MSESATNVISESRDSCPRVKRLPPHASRGHDFGRRLAKDEYPTEHVSKGRPGGLRLEDHCSYGRRPDRQW